MRSVRNAGGNFSRNRQDAVPISVQQIVWPDFHSSHGNRGPNLEYMGVRMGDGHATSEQLQPCPTCARQLANGPVRYIGDTTHRLQNGGMHISQESSAPRRFIHILQYQNPRSRSFENAVPELRSVAEPATADRGLPAAQTSGSCISYDRAHVFQQSRSEE